MHRLRRFFSRILGIRERRVVSKWNFITENLWKKESSQDGGLYIDFLKDVAAYPSVLPYVSRKHKKYKVAAKLMVKANKKMVAKNYLGALNDYNKSICFSEIGTEILSLAYANRSGCFLFLDLYNKCLADIELAIAAKCPEECKAELLIRKEYCLEQMETKLTIKECSPKLSFEEDERFPGMANVLEIKYNEEFGRHITAKCDIDVGKVILIEKSFLLTSNIRKWKFCNHCLKRVTNLIPCDRCTNAMYCDSTCLESDIFHETECGIIYDSGIVSLLTQHIQRSLITAINIFPTTEDLMEFVEEAVRDKSNKVPSNILDNKSKYYSFLRLHMHWSLERLTDFSEMIHPLYHYILSVPSLTEKFNTERKQRFLMHLIGQHYCIAATNAFEDGMDIKIYINTSYFNHSCSSNVRNYIHRGWMSCVVTRPILKDEQLYIPYSQENDTRIRQNELNKSWGVQCKCEKCEPCSESISNDEKLFPCISTDFDIIVNALKDESYKTDKTKYFMVKKMLLNFLRKYGRLHWNDKIELVTRYFMKALSLKFEFISED